MSVAVRPMTDEEYPSWQARSQEAYAADMVASGGLDPERAHAKAKSDFAALLTEGVATPGHDLFTVEADGHVAGSLWLSEREVDMGRAYFVYELYVDEAFRGRGVGRGAMQFAEEEARRRGIPRVSLNVFGGNDVARGLYRSLGYVETAVFMVKEL